MEKNTISINRKVATFSKSFEVNGDVIVPDIKPDILSIINTNGNSYIYREDIVTGRVRIDGNLDTYTVYLSDSGETRSIQSTLNFSESFEDSQISDGCFLRSRVLIESIESKVLNERKLSIRATLRIRCEVFMRDEIEVGINLDEIEGANTLQKWQEKVNTKTLIGNNKVKTNVKEDISVDPSYEIAEILKVSVAISNLENKISYNKVLAKADANVKILFLAEDGKIGSVTQTIPVMSFIDLEGVQEGQECSPEYSIRNMLFKINSKEMHSISCQIDFEVALEVYENREIDVIQDMYGIRNNVEFNKRSVLVPLNSNCPEEKINISENVLVEDVLSIYDVESFINVLNNSQNNFECEIVLKIYYEADSRNGLNCKEVKLPFFVRTSNFGPEITKDNLNFQVTKEQFTVNGENVNCEMDILCTQDGTSNKEISLIENVSITELDSNDDYKMYMYFVKEGDTIWNIAKQFRVNMEDIIKLNELENPDRINVGDRIFIMR